MPIAMKVISSDRSVRKRIVAVSYQDVLQKCKEKFQVSGIICVVTDEDGFEVDEDFFESLSHMTHLMVLTPSEIWTKRTGTSDMSRGRNDISGDTKSDSNPSLVDLVAKIRNKQTSLYQNAVSRPKMKYKLKMGWLLWNDTKYMYVQVRLKTGGGVRDVDFPGEAGHVDLLQKGKELFFPDGQNSFRGYFDDYHQSIGDFRQTVLPENISVMEYVTKNSLSNRPRIYLMSKQKSQEENLELADLDFPVNVDMLSSFMDENLPMTLANTSPTSSSNTAIAQTATNLNLEQDDLSSTAHQSTSSCDTDTLITSYVPLPHATTQTVTNLNFEQAEQSRTAQQGTGTISLNQTTTQTVTNLNMEQDEHISTADIEISCLAPHNEARPENRCLRLGRRRAALRCRQFMANSLQRHMPRSTLAMNSSSSFETIETVDSEDEELQRALFESIESEQRANTRSEEPAVQLSILLKEFQRKVNRDSKQEIIISRKHVLESTFRALSRKFDAGCNIYVKFSGEMGLDHGGPRREFFRLVMQELSISSLFEGHDFAKLFSHDIKKLERKEYYMAGKIAAMSVLHEGPGINFLNEHLCRLMLDMEPELESFNLDFLPDVEERDILNQLKKGDTEIKKDQFISTHGDWLINQGYKNAWSLHVQERQTVVQNMIQQFIFYRTLPEGMDDVLDFWQVLKSNPVTSLSSLCHKPSPFTKDQFMNLFKTNWSEEASNRRSLEEDTIFSWEIFLQDIQDKVVDVTYEDVLVFVSGADKVPPCGFPSDVIIDFYTYEESSKRLPFASTCSLTLSLPRGVNCQPRCI